MCDFIVYKCINNVVLCKKDKFMFCVVIHVYDEDFHDV